MLVYDKKCVNHSKFQPTPADDGGRCAVTGGKGEPGSWFQPTPADDGGRCILKGPTWTPTSNCFNPRPPMTAGDAQVFDDVADGGDVSTHARR